MKKIVIIGAGAAGMAAAGFLLENGEQNVTLIEKNDRVGKKLSITGKGRCNVTNNCAPNEMLANVIRNPKFLYSAVYSFKPEDTMSLFERLGVPLKTERGRRVFPVSDKAADIVAALRRFSVENGASLLYGKVSEIMTEGGHITGVRIGSKTLEADCVILAAGGNAYPSIGGSDIGYRLASSLGHSVISPEPSLVPLAVSSDEPQKLMGLSLRNVNLELKRKDKTIFSEQGELLFTHYGISGPLTLSGSCRLGENEGCTAIIDLKPALSYEKLDERILRDFAERKNRNFENSLSALLPSKLIPVIIKRSGIPPEKKVNSITKEERLALVSLLKGFSLPVSGKRGFSEAIITRGGVDTSEISPKTMESKLISGLYFAGEVIDVDALTGGYNLQIAFSTAHSAAEAIAALYS